MKKPDERGQTMSAPAEIAKLRTARCQACGLVAVAPIVVGNECTNLAACKKRRRRTERIARERKGGA